MIGTVTFTLHRPPAAAFHTRFPLAMSYLHFLDRYDSHIAAARVRCLFIEFPPAVELWGALDRRDKGLMLPEDRELLA